MARLAYPQLQSSRRRQDGAVLVESIVCMVLLLLLTSGIIDYGGLFGTTINVAGSNRSAVRAGVHSTSTVATDADIINALTDGSGRRRTDIEKLIIFKADDGQSSPPAACINAYPQPPGQLCDVYRGQDLDAAAAGNSPLPAENGWPPINRQAGRDYLGLWLQIDHDSLLGLVWSPSKFRDTFVMQIAPLEKPSTAPITGAQWSTGTANAPTWPDQWWCAGVGACPPRGAGSGGTAVTTGKDHGKGT